VRVETKPLQRIVPSARRCASTASGARSRHLDHLRGELRMGVRPRRGALRAADGARLLRVRREQQLRVDAAVVRAQDRRLGLELAQLRLELRQSRGGHAIDLVQHQQVGRRDLLREGVAEVATRGELLGVHDHDRDVVRDPLPHRIAPELELRVVGQSRAEVSIRMRSGFARSRNEASVATSSSESLQQTQPPRIST